MASSLVSTITDAQGRRGLTLALHPGQERAWESRRRFIFVLAGTQSGKTSLLPLWLHREIATCGAGDYLAVSSTFPLLKLKMLPEFLKFFQHTLGLGTWHASDRVFEFSTDGAERTYGTQEPSRLIFGSATNAESLESATAKAAVADEVGQDDFRLESYEAMLRRLALHQGRLLAGTTVYSLGWLKQIVYDPWLDGKRPDTDIIQFDSTTNPAFPRAEYERAVATMPAWKVAMFYRGEFARPAGMIYSDFIDDYRERGGHKVRPFDLPPEWARYCGIDFGAVNTATVWLARDSAANVYYLYHETHEGGKSSKQHAQQATATAAGVNMVSWHGGAKSEDQQRMDWASGGVPAQEPLVSDVEAGIDRVIELFKASRLYVFDTCRGVLDELGRYSRELDEMQQPTEKIKDKERFHRLDALRYVVQALTRPLAATGGLDRQPVARGTRLGLWGR